MTSNPKFIMIGGFLGAGKTTTVGRLAKHFHAQGKRVAIVTNDQASDLVDTHLLRSQGFDVGEVAGSCFCCNFNELTSTVERLGANQRPEVVIAEPVGSCTDLVATVIRPLQQIYDQPLDIAPYGVIIKPSHGMKILRRSGKGGFSPQAEYIFRKQIEEADFAILNRIDELTSETVQELEELIQAHFGNMPTLRMSAVTGDGFSELCRYLDQPGRFGMRTMEVDYDVYAQGEAELGWLNAQVTLNADTPIDLDPFLMECIERIANRLRTLEAEVAHLKVIGMSDGAYGVVNLVSSDSLPKLSLSADRRVDHAELVVNARVAIDPTDLTRVIEDTLQTLAAEQKMRLTVRAIQSFRPGRPVPTHRLTDAASSI
jgi:Ni2+-binding GTPase involved in maturation of urease and hydrogenase